jgi:hypothetical protein
LTAALTLPETGLNDFLVSWRQQLCLELITNASGQLSRWEPLLAENVHKSFLNPKTVLLYAKPVTTWTPNTSVSDHFVVQLRALNIAELAQICEQRFNWVGGLGGVPEKVHTLCDGMCVCMLCNVVGDCTLLLHDIWTVIMP